MIVNYSHSLPDRFLIDGLAADSNIKDGRIRLIRGRKAGNAYELAILDVPTDGNEVNAISVREAADTADRDGWSTYGQIIPVKDRADAENKFSQVDKEAAIRILGKAYTIAEIDNMMHKERINSGREYYTLEELGQPKKS